jgi:hypothetical protein
MTTLTAACNNDNDYNNDYENDSAGNDDDDDDSVVVIIGSKSLTQPGVAHEPTCRIRAYIYVYTHTHIRCVGPEKLCLRKLGFMKPASLY